MAYQVALSFNTSTLSTSRVSLSLLNVTRDSVIRDASSNPNDCAFYFAAFGRPLRVTMVMNGTSIRLLAAAALCHAVSAYYLPGVNPQSFGKGDA
jgi:hypothetical protein